MISDPIRMWGTLQSSGITWTLWQFYLDFFCQVFQGKNILPLNGKYQITLSIACSIYFMVYSWYSNGILFFNKFPYDMILKLCNLLVNVRYDVFFFIRPFLNLLKKINVSQRRYSLESYVKKSTFSLIRYLLEHTS